MKKLILSFSLFLLGAFSSELLAQDLVYQPENPAFGGSYLNYSWMLSSAQAQNTYEDPEAASAPGRNRDPLASFQEDLNRQILNQLSRQIISSQFGEEGLEEGEYQLGSYNINVADGADGFQIEIYDTSTGGTTTVVVPYNY